MMEFEINMSEMPLGKLSKRHIEKGDTFSPLFFFGFSAFFSGLEEWAFYFLVTLLVALHILLTFRKWLCACRVPGVD
jgi:hypothetical protein